ncbi:hypothetical protein DID88_006953 [Monilinia fructigena]|uniref:Uncharacterized protein n=1 Tax=Monilinia fructigena TaxID=38457 RepID=A0A395IIF6_9HELO|nr:hypothetical protein DID88_006953 [Monilinia fructigena]
MGLRNNPAVLRVFLIALASHDLFWRFFANPFFFLGQEVSQALNDIMSMGNTWSLAEAQRWRSDKLRLIFPERDTNGSEQKNVKSQTKELIHKAAVTGAKAFLQSPARYVIDQKPETVQKLEEVYIIAAEHAYLLLTERTVMEIHDLSKFGGQLYFEEEERLHRKMELHGMVNIEESTKKPTDYPISLVVSPQLEASGATEIWDDEEGNEHHSNRKPPIYERHLSWLPAYVWMYLHKPGEPENEDPAGQAKYFPPRVEESSETPAERLLKTFDRVPLLELIMPYLDTLADEPRPVIEGLREEIRQLKSKCKEKESDILLWKDRAEKLQTERNKFKSKYSEAIQSLGIAFPKSTDIKSSAEFRTMQAKYQMDIDSLQRQRNEMAQEIKRLKF